MSRMREVACVALTSDQEVDPIAWEQTMDYLCRLMLEQYFQRHPRAPKNEENNGTGMGVL